MQWLTRLHQCLRDLTARKQQEVELDEELKFHLAMQEEKNHQAGMNQENAHRSAMIEIGGVEQIKEQVRSERFGFWFDTVLKDVTYGLRMLRKTPAITFVSLITLSLAIGACTALFSIFYTILLSPLPYPQPEELAQIWDTNLTKGISRIGVNGLNVEDWRQRVSGFNGIAAYYTMGRTLTSGNDSEVVLVSQVSADFFGVFRTQPLFGRTFSDAESKDAKFNMALGAVNPDPVAILSHGLWVRRFGGDPKIVGKTIILERRLWKVIGVMPPHFAMPETGTQLWIPWGLHHDSMRDQHFAGGIARLNHGVTVSQAEDRLNEVANQLSSAYPESNAGWTVRILPLHEAMTGDLKQLLWVLLAAVSLVLMIGCANVAILQLSRASARMHESSIRLALGASRSRLFRQFLIESLILAFAGGVVGIGFAYLGIEWLQRIQPNLPRLSEISINQTVLLTSIVLSGLTALLFGLIPAAASAGSKKHSALHGESFRTTSNISTQRLRNALVATEVALAVVLLASSGMLIRSFAKLRAVDSGYNARNVLVLPIFLDIEKYGSGEKSRAYYTNLIENLQLLPGVVSVGGATALPTSPLGPDFERPVWDESGLAVDQNKRSADVRMVTTDYFRTLGISILRGRGFSAQDGPDAPHVVIVNQTLASQIWPGDPVGKKLVVDYSSSGTYAYEIVGVVHDIRFHGPRSQPRAEIYFPHAQKPYLILNIAIRTTENPRLLINSVRELLRRIDPQKPAHNITPLEDLVGATVTRDRYAMTLLSCFAIVALLLAMLGIYGVLAFFVRQKVQEIGIRLALGARQNQITTWIAKQGTRLVIIGVVAGLLATLLFSRLLAGILYEVSPLDILSLAVAVFALALTVITATWIPARRASRIDPSIALRYE